MTACTETGARPRLLFVDDEQRVLNSMRIMFRRQFDLYLASDGAQALDIVKSSDIDVIVADHRMPRMTGVEVLSTVRALSPHTVRILLTGYADLDAVEGSINDCEVFRFLTKPCAPLQLRETIELAAKVARETRMPALARTDRASVEQPGIADRTADGEGAGRRMPDAAEDEHEDEETVEIILESDSVQQISGSGRHERPATSGQRRAAGEMPDPTKTDVLPGPPPEPALAAGNGARTTETGRRLATGLAVVVFSNDDEVLEVVQKAVRGRLPVYQAGNIVQVVKILTEHRPGVLVTDISNDKATIQAMTAKLKDHLPELVTIAVSQHRDVLDMVWLINHGQIFRFLSKPLSPGRCAVSLQAALQHHRMLLKNPALARRHEVDASAELGLVDGVIEKLKVIRRLWASA